jgi:hypothetical protein
MNQLPKRPFIPFDSLGERLLAAVAIKLELPPSQHLLMTRRKQAIEKHLERDGSPLKDLIRIFYQQGSVAIGATIKAKHRDVGFDIDIIVELLLNGISPSEALDLLYEAIRGEPGSRYYDCTARQTRCVTVHYADGMHIDLSPSVLLEAGDPRRSNIFHSKPEEPRSSDYYVLMNSFGFAEHYNALCPVDQLFSEAYAKRVMAADQAFEVLTKDADSVPVPEHSSEVGGKSAVTVGLQLLKRNRDIRWIPREGKRMPASAMFSCLTVEVAEAGRTIGENLRIIASHILNRLLIAKSLGELIVVENPRCSGDIFTDRWPENRNDQDLLIEDMKLFLRQLEVVLDESRSLKDRTAALEAMFGETVARDVVKDFAEETGGLVQSGKHALGAAGGILAAPASARAKPAAKKNTFFGSTRPLRFRTGLAATSLSAQAKAIARRWPQFQVTSGMGPQSLVWFGDLKGLERSFHISVEYGLPRPGDTTMSRFMPIVRVLRPSLVLNFDAIEEAPLPHVYFERPDIRLSPLCLFDPQAHEWDRTMLIADTTIPWAARWLACYEIWEATGRWVGGGRHAGEEDQDDAA